MTRRWVDADHGGYTGGGWTSPRTVPAIDSDQPCQVNTCTRAAGNATVCPHCLNTLEQALGDVPALLEDLLVMTTRQHRMPPATGKRQTGPKGTRWDQNVTAASARILRDEGFNRVPYVAAAGDAHQAITKAVLSAAQHLTEGTTATVPTEALTGSRWLLMRLRGIQHSHHGPVIVETITGAHNKAMRVIDRPDEAIYVGLCPTPDCRTPLHANPELPEVRCYVCAETHNVAELRTAIRDKLSGEVLPLRTISELSGTSLGIRIPLHQLKNWANRDNRLTPAATNTDNPKRPVNLYRVSDVLDLVSNNAD